MTINQNQFREMWEDKIKATCQKNGGDGAFENLLVGMKNASFIFHFSSSLCRSHNDYFIITINFIILFVDVVQQKQNLFYEI